MKLTRSEPIMVKWSCQGIMKHQNNTCRSQVLPFTVLESQATWGTQKKFGLLFLTCPTLKWSFQLRICELKWVKKHGFFPATFCCFLYMISLWFYTPQVTLNKQWQRMSLLIHRCSFPNCGYMSACSALEGKGGDLHF